MPPHLCLILLLLAASLAVSGINPASAAAGVGGEDPNAYNSSICHKSFTCGSHDIHYPFYLANQSRQVIDGVAYAYCGYPGMAILCDAASTTATLRLAGGTNYTVLNIDYASHTITLADADALKDTSGCPKPRHNVTIPPEAWLNFTATGNGTISFFLDCDPAAGPPPLLDIIPINCTGFAASLTSLSFLAPNLGAPDGVGDWSWSCAEVYVAPVLSEWLASPEYSPRLGSGGYGDVLRRGFRLSWDPSAGPCYKCELTSGQCGYDQFGVFLGCLCSDGRVHGPVCVYPGMAILCENSTATLQLGGGINYTVLAIDYGNHTITVADADALANTACPRVQHNVTIPPETWLNFTSTGNSTISFFLDCSFTGAVTPPPELIPINCTGFAQGPSPSFLAPQLGVPEGEWFQACREVYVAPVLKEWLASPEYRPRLGSGGYGDVLRRGFRLSWDPSAGPCYECELSGGLCGYDQAGEFLGCLCSDGRVRGPVCGVEHLTNARITFIVGRASGILVICLISIACLLGYKAYRSRKRSKETPRIESFLQKSAAVYPKRYSYAQVKKMTGTFAEKLGQGGFGVVYRGGLSGGRQIAVKMLKDSKADVEEFINEVASISTTSHVNVVTLLGFCLEGSKRALIYDYMPNGSLERYAFKRNSNGEKTLSWEKLFDIAVGIARGLEYLHRGCNTRIVHFDIKPHNILLDQDFCPKISDFGMAKLCPNKESVISIGGARGTIGYIAPEVFSKQFGPVSSKSDVYSYGMMVLEMVGARDKHINVNASTERSSQYFPQWIYENLDDYCFSASEINSEITEIVRKMIIIGLWCIQLSASNRPTMTRVVEMLEGSTGCLELPPQVLIS